MGYVYLIHWEPPIGNPDNRRGQAAHYLGYTSTSLKKRLQVHKSGQGAKITKAAALLYGRELQLVRHWNNGSRQLERALKRRHCPRYYCPLCNPMPPP